MPKPEDIVLNKIDEFLDRYVDRVFELSQTNLIDMEKVDRALLLKSGNVNRSFLDKEIVYSMNYSDTIEYGRLPGSMPPVDPLVKWVKRKLNIKNDREAQSIAWAIAQKIKKVGTEANPYLRNAINAASLEFGLNEVRV